MRNLNENPDNYTPIVSVPTDADTWTSDNISGGAISVDDPIGCQGITNRTAFLRQRTLGVVPMPTGDGVTDGVRVRWRVDSVANLIAIPTIDGAVAPGQVIYCGDVVLPGLYMFVAEVAPFADDVYVFAPTDGGGVGGGWVHELAQWSRQPAGMPPLGWISPITHAGTGTGEVIAVGLCLRPSLHVSILVANGGTFTVGVLTPDLTYAVALNGGSPGPSVQLPADGIIHVDTLTVAFTSGTYVTSDTYQFDFFGQKLSPAFLPTNTAGGVPLLDVDTGKVGDTQLGRGAAGGVAALDSTAGGAQGPLVIQKPRAQRTYVNQAALQAEVDYAAGDTAVIHAIGEYSFIGTDPTADDGLYTLRPSTGPSHTGNGRWVSTLRALLNISNGIVQVGHVRGAVVDQGILWNEGDAEGAPFTNTLIGTAGAADLLTVVTPESGVPTPAVTFANCAVGDVLEAEATLVVQPVLGHLLKAMAGLQVVKPDTSVTVPHGAFAFATDADGVTMLPLNILMRYTVTSPGSHTVQLVGHASAGFSNVVSFYSPSFVRARRILSV